MRQGHLERVTPDEALANRILDIASTHLATAEREAALDPYVAYAALYDAARKALTALLQIQGLRPTRKGGHLAVLETARAQLDPPLGQVLRPMDRLRRVRHAAEYPDVATAITKDDVVMDLPKAKAIVEVAQKVITQLPVFVTK